MSKITVKRLSDNTVHEVFKYIKSPEGEESVWCASWYGHHVIGVDCEFCEQSPEPEQQQKKSFCLDEEGGERCERQCQPCREVDYLDSKQQPPSELEREIQEIRLFEEIHEIINSAENFNAGQDLTQFILSREEDLRKQLQDEHRKYTYYRDHCERLEAENERLKGEREKHAIVFAESLREYERESRNLLGFDERTTEELYTEYLKSNNK